MEIATHEGGARAGPQPGTIESTTLFCFCLENSKSVLLFLLDSAHEQKRLGILLLFIIYCFFRNMIINFSLSSIRRP